MDNALNVLEGLIDKMIVWDVQKGLDKLKVGSVLLVLFSVELVNTRQLKIPKWFALVAMILFPSTKRQGSA